MKERPILFNAQMVNAILSGRKTQTRRIMKIQPKDQNSVFATIVSSTVKGESGLHYWRENNYRGDGATFKSPYGYSGDKLWVRETFGTCIRNVGGTPQEKTIYRADGEEVYSYGRDGEEMKVKWKPSIFMPRKLSRIDLEITGVRVERLNDISEEDAKAEGLIYHRLYDEWGVEKRRDSRENMPQWRRYGTPAKAFEYLWKSINGVESWNKNPLVWVIEFRKIKGVEL